MPNEPKQAQDRAWDSASVEIIKKAEQECIDTCFTRMDLQENQC